MQSVLGGNQFLRGDSKCFGRADQVGFVVGEKFERCGKDQRIAQPGAQRIGVEPGKIEKARGPVLAFEHPAERRQRQRLQVERPG